MASQTMTWYDLQEGEVTPFYSLNAIENYVPSASRNVAIRITVTKEAIIPSTWYQNAYPRYVRKVERSTPRIMAEVQ